MRKLKGNLSTLPDNIDDVNGADQISDLFTKKYHALYNSVSFDKNEMNTLKTSIDNLVTDHSGCDEQSHIITVANICENLVFMKSGKNYGQFGHYSDHIINGTLKLNVYYFFAVY